MTITSVKPYTLEEIKKLKVEFGEYIKTVIDVKKKMCVAGMNRHFEGEQILLEKGSGQSNLWGGGIDLETKEVDYNSFINIRPNDNNLKNEIQSEKVKAKYNKLTKFFFKAIYG